MTRDVIPDVPSIGRNVSAGFSAKSVRNGILKVWYGSCPVVTY